MVLELASIDVPIDVPGGNAEFKTTNTSGTWKFRIALAAL
jgi:hypothetical protein